MADNQHATERLFTESRTARGNTAGCHPDITLGLRVQAAAALAVALSAWVQSDGVEALPTLANRAFRTLRHQPLGRQQPLGR